MAEMKLLRTWPFAGQTGQDLQTVDSATVHIRYASHQCKAMSILGKVVRESAVQQVTKRFNQGFGSERFGQL
jgi:hypothetical protein